jgi:DNA-binding transcriptional regulator YiaG
MEKETREQMRQRLDEAALGYRLGRTAAGEMASWLRALRQTLGVPVEEFARRLGVKQERGFQAGEVRGGVAHPTGNAAAGGGGAGLRVGLRLDAAAGER